MVKSKKNSQISINIDFTKLYYMKKGDLFGCLVRYHTELNLEKCLKYVKEGKIVDSVVTVEQYSPDLLKLSVNLDEDSQLVASINYYPFWHAFVDGKKREIYRYLDTFMIIDVYKNEHSIIFKYSPPYAVF